MKKQPPKKRAELREWITTCTQVAALTLQVIVMLIGHDFRA